MRTTYAVHWLRFDLFCIVHFCVLLRSSQTLWLTGWIGSPWGGALYSPSGHAADAIVLRGRLQARSDRDHTVFSTIVSLFLQVIGAVTCISNCDHDVLCDNCVQGMTPLDWLHLYDVDHPLAMTSLLRGLQQANVALRNPSLSVRVVRLYDGPGVFESSSVVRGVAHGMNSVVPVDVVF